MRRLVAVLLPILALGLCYAPGAAAQPPKKADAGSAKGPAKAAPAAPRKDPLAGFDDWVETVRMDWKIPGLAVSIVKDGQVIYAKGFGLRNVKQNLPVTPDTLFAIGSNSKAFTAASLGILVDEGKLDWDKPVRQYIPSFKMNDDYVTEHLTPRDLVTHRSGLPRHDLMWYGGPFSRKEMFDRLRHLEPSRGFRASYQYQNLMFMTAGYLVEQVTGQTWEQFIRRRFFEPMEMRASNTSVTELPRAADASLPYQEEKGEVKEVPYRNIDQIGPAGSINSSAREMAAWLIVQMNKGKYKDKQIIPEAQLRQTQTPQVVVPPSPTAPAYDELFYNSYAMGWIINAYRGHLLHAHGGGIDGFISQVSMLPKQKLGVVVLTNLSPNAVPDVIVYNVYDRFLGLEPVDWNTRRKDERAKAREAQQKAEQDSEAGRKTGTQPTHALADYTGKFEHPGYGVLTIAQGSDTLTMSYNGLRSPLRHYHFDVFETTESSTGRLKFNFAMNQKGDIDKVRVPLQGGVPDIVFTRMPSGEAGPETLKKLVGEYELPGASVKVWLRDEKTLMATVAGQPDYELVPYQGLEFQFKGLTGFSIEFKMSGDTPGEAVITQPNGVFTAKRKM